MTNIYIYIYIYFFLVDIIRCHLERCGCFGKDEDDDEPIPHNSESIELMEKVDDYLRELKDRGK